MQRLTLTVDGEAAIESPTPEQVCAAVARLAAGGPGFIILDGPGDDFAQAARRRDGFTAEWREHLAQGVRHWKAGRAGSSAAGETAVPYDAPAFVERPNERLTAPEVSVILLAYLSCQVRPSQFTWRDITAMFP
jgi:hypothetical protein